MEVAIYIALGLGFICAALLVAILLKVGRPAALPEELANRLAVLEQVTKTLPDALREEARAGRDELRTMFSGQP